MKTKTEWPRTVRSGNAAVKVYKRITGSGNVGFRIAYCDTDGKRKFESSSVETEALKLAQRKAEILSTFGARVAGTSSNEIAEFVRLGDLLKPFNVGVTTVVERVTWWLSKLGTLEAMDHAITSGPAPNGATITPRTVPQAVAELLAQKRANKMSEAYCKDIEFRLQNKFAAAFTCNVDTVTTSQLQAWLDGRKMPASTYRNFARLLSTLFEFCKTRNYCALNPAASIEARKVVQGDTAIYSPAEMQKLLAASDNGFQLMLAICGFAGLRTAEFERLTWDNIDFASGHIVLNAGQTKTKSRRLVPMSANLRAWLELYKNRTGPVWTAGNMDYQQERAGKLAGVRWKKNALRHSFCSYRLAQTGDAARTAFEAGNSANMVHRHYKALVTEQAAREWFAIVPPQSSTVEV
jgi:integrase